MSSTTSDPDLDAVGHCRIGTPNLRACGANLVDQCVEFRLIDRIALSIFDPEVMHDHVADHDERCRGNDYENRGQHGAVCPRPAAVAQRTTNSALGVPLECPPTKAPRVPA